jgi:hypothetical protein
MASSSIRDLRNEYNIFVGKLKRRDISTDGGIILKWIFEMNNAKVSYSFFFCGYHCLMHNPLKTYKDLQTST